jgi:hypothetical protein
MSSGPDAKQVETAILLRMAESREALLAANRAPLSIHAGRRLAEPAGPSLVSALASAPRVSLLLALCVSAIIVGPRRTIGIAGRTGTTAWLGGTVRKAILQAV